MRLEYPSIDDVKSIAETGNPKVSEYSFGSSLIDDQFAWSKMREARRTMFQLAQVHQVGFFDVSAEDRQV